VTSLDIGNTDVALATTDDLLAWGSNRTLTEGWDTAGLTKLMLGACTQIENRCGRRLAPFSAKIESHRAQGVDPAGLVGANQPLNLAGSLARSEARAYQFQNLVRDFWLNEYAPTPYSELYSLSITSIQVVLAIGGVESVELSVLEGPQITTGHLRIGLGTFCPEGSTVIITYGGGYTGGIPYDLNLACILQATKQLILGAEPQQRQGMSLVELDGEILSLIAPYIK